MLRHITLVLTVFCFFPGSHIFGQTQLNVGEPDGIRVVTTIKPLQLIVSAITDGISTPVLLIPANQSYHHYTLRPSAVRILDDADLVIWVGPELETYLTSLFAQVEAKTSVIRAFELPGLRRHELNKTIAVAGDESHDHDHSGQYDAHIWLDTDNALLIAEAAAQQLSAIDPANASHYNINLTAFSVRLQQAQQRNAVSSAALKNLGYAVYHNAFQYFEKQNGLQHQLVFVTTEDMQPGIRHIMAVRNALQQLRPVCLLEDVTTNPTTVTTVLGDFSIRRERVDLLGEKLAPGPDAYTQLIRNVAGAFQRCLAPR